MKYRKLNVYRLLKNTGCQRKQDVEVQTEMRGTKKANGRDGRVLKRNQADWRSLVSKVGTKCCITCT